jgi:hypothetical protein
VALSSSPDAMVIAENRSPTLKPLPALYCRGPKIPPSEWHNGIQFTV